MSTNDVKYRLQHAAIVATGSADNDGYAALVTIRDCNEAIALIDDLQAQRDSLLHAAHENIDLGMDLANAMFERFINAHPSLRQHYVDAVLRSFGE